MRLANTKKYEIQIMQDNLCDLRKIAGWTAETLAVKLGITKQTISNLETQKVKMSRVQYIAIRAVFECEIYVRRENTVLRKVIELLFSNDEYYLSHQEEVRNVMTAIASIAAAGISGLQLHSSAVALLAPLGHMVSIQNMNGKNAPSLAWLVELLEGPYDIEEPESNMEKEQTNEEG